MSKFYQFNSKYLDETFYLTVTRPYNASYSTRIKQKHFKYIRVPTYEDMLDKYYDYKEAIDDARAQADRWRY